MNYHVKCVTCGAEWHCRGDYEEDTNVTNLDDSKIHEGQCQCGDGVEILGCEPADDEDLYV